MAGIGVKTICELAVRDIKQGAEFIDMIIDLTPLKPTSINRGDEQSVAIVKWDIGTEVVSINLTPSGDLVVCSQLKDSRLSESQRLVFYEKINSKAEDKFACIYRLRKLLKIDVKKEDPHTRATISFE